MQRKKISCGKRYYEGVRKQTTVCLVIAWFLTVLGAAFFLVSAAFFVQSGLEGKIGRSRTELFDPLDTTGMDDSYKTMRIRTMTYEFAEESLGTYYYCLAVTEMDELRIIRIREDHFKELQPLVDYMYEIDSPKPEPVEVRGTAGLICEEVREFALELMNFAGGEGDMTYAELDAAVGKCYLDLAGVPRGGENYGRAWSMFSMAVIWSGLGAVLFITQIRRRKNAALEEEREARMFSDVHQYMEAGETTVEYDAESAAGLRPEEPEEVRTGSLAAGILGALGGALLGVILWCALGIVGVIAGIAGYAMLNFALRGYEKFYGTADRKGTAICILIVILMIPAAGMLQYFIELCQMIAETETAAEAFRYTASNFFLLMRRGEVWTEFFKSVLIGYVLSFICSGQLMREAFRRRK
ncbi:MAG: hypothetical protein MR528_09835 [Lachnospiraceae bacterium]|nr:hypothetical protein [Lachnospiraceae bacterium]